MKLPKDAVLEILLRLPVRSLLRFSCVCKDWCALIKSSLFKNRYLALRRARAGGDEFIAVQHSFGSDDDYGDVNYKNFVTCCNGDYESLALSVSAASSKDFDISGDYSKELTFINHVNGIVCFSGLGANNRLYITLLNPFLRELKTLPNIGYECFTDGIGFGFDDATNEYKVVAIITLFQEVHQHIAAVYHLSTNSWTILGDMSAFVSQCYLSEPDFMDWPCFSRSIFSHGSIHWIIEFRKDYELYRILTFNMTNELFQVIHFPQGWKDYDEGVWPYLLTVDESTIVLLALTDPSANDSCGQVLDVWVMKEYGVGDSWTKQYSITSLPLIWKPLSFWRKDHLLLQTFSGELIYYHLLKGQLYQPGQRDPICVPDSVAWSVEILTCSESFVSIK